MNQNCRYKLIKHFKQANSKDANYCYALLKTKQKEIKTVFALASFLKTTKSSASRFTKRLGYDSFKEFKTDFNAKDLKISFRLQKSFIKSGIALICSKRTMIVGQEIYQKLQKHSINTAFFDPHQETIYQFINHNANHFFILLTLTGDSNIFNQAITIFAQNKTHNQAHNILILTYAQYLKVFSKYDFIEVISIGKKNYQPESWLDYEICYGELITNCFIYLKYKLNG